MRTRALLSAAARCLVLGALASALACASPAPPPPPVVKAKPKVEAPGPLTTRICGSMIRRISFAGLGIPLYSRILDVAVTADRVWLLVDRSRLVELWRSPEEAKFRAVTGRESAAWDALDVDPLDGSLWLVSNQRLELIHLNPGGESRVVRIPKLEGEGGFRDVLADATGIWVVPTCAEDALWKVDREGKVLEQAFRREGQEPLTLRKEFTPEEGGRSIVGCVPVSLARDLDGRLAVFDGVTRSFYRQEDGGWRPFLAFPEPARAALPSGGVRVDFPGTGNETWAPVSTYTGDAPGFFFAGDAPLFQPSAFYQKDSLVRYLQWVRPEPEGPVTEYERCDALGPLSGLLVASDRSGYVTVTGGEVVFGIFPSRE